MIGINDPPGAIPPYSSKLVRLYGLSPLQSCITEAEADNRHDDLLCLNQCKQSYNLPPITHARLESFASASKLM